MMIVIKEVGSDESGVCYGRVQGFANAPESKERFNWRPCKDVQHDFVWEIIIVLRPTSQDRSSFFFHLGHFPTEETGCMLTVKQ